MSTTYDTPQSLLTEIEVSAQSDPRTDLATGYPLFELPSWLQRTLTDKKHVEKALNTYLTDKGRIADRFDENILFDSIYRLLGVSSTNYWKPLLLPNGSTAINRAIAVMAKKNGHVVICDPTFDVIPAMVGEHSNLTLRVVPTHECIENQMFQILDCIDEDCVGVILCSPENPTGRVFSHKHLQEITKKCAEFDAIAVIDQCFATVGEHFGNTSIVTESCYRGAKCMMLWDTGKTLGIHHEKLAIILSTPEIFSEIYTACKLLCFSVNYRVHETLMYVLGDVRFNTYVDDCAKTLTANASRVFKSIENLPGTKFVHSGGSFGLLYFSTSLSDISRKNISDWIFKKYILVPLEVFFLTQSNISINSSSDSNIGYRIALNRPATTIDEFASHLRRYVLA